MRTSAPRGRSVRPLLLLGAVAAGLIVAACGVAAPTPVPAATPTPKVFATASPWAHLTEPATADDVFSALVADGLAIVPNTASSGGPGKDPVKRIEATYLGWPLAIAQYRSSKTLRKATAWKAGAKPRQGEPPVAFIGLNILVTWGPSTGAAPRPPVGAQLAGALALRASLERLLSPLSVRTIVNVPGPTPTPQPSVSAAPSGSAGPSAAPSAAPSPVPSPVPSGSAAS